MLAVAGHDYDDNNDDNDFITITLYYSIPLVSFTPSPCLQSQLRVATPDPNPPREAPSDSL